MFKDCESGLRDRNYSGAT